MDVIRSYDDPTLNRIGIVTMVSEPLPQNLPPNSPKPILASLYPFSSSPSPLVPSLPNYLQPKSMAIAKTSSPNSPLPSPTATTTPPSSSTPSPTPPPGPTSSSTPSYPTLTPSSPPLPKMPPTSPTPHFSTSIPATATAVAPAPLCGSSSTIRRNSPEEQEVNSSNFNPIPSSSNRAPGIRPNVSLISSTQVGPKPVLEYYCNLCLDNCSYQRYQCITLQDYDLCLTCFAREGLGLRLTPLDFSYIEDDERQFDVLEYWCNHCFANCTDEHYRCNKFLNYHLCPTCVTNGEFELGLTLRDFVLVKAAEEDSLPAIKASKRDDGRRTTSDHMKKSSSTASFRIDNISRSKGASSDVSNRSHEVLIGNGSSVNVLHIDPEVTSLEHETHLQTPFANPANPVMSLVAFLTSAITPRVAADCASASLGVLTKGDPRLSFISSHNEDGSHGAYANLGHQNIPYAENDATLASVCLVPLTSVLLLFELTKGYRFFLPLMVVHTRWCSFALARGSAAAEINPSKWLLEALEQTTPRSLFQPLSLKEEEVPFIVIQENDGKKYLKQNVGADQITIWFEEYTDGSLTPNSWLITKRFIFDPGGRHRENILGLSHVERGMGGGSFLRDAGKAYNELKEGEPAIERFLDLKVVPYCASKWAIEGLTGAVAKELPPSLAIVALSPGLTGAVAKELPPGLAIVALSPGVVNTEMLASCFGSSAALYETPEA